MTESIINLAQQALAYIDECPDNCPVCGSARGDECHPDHWCGKMRAQFNYPSDDGEYIALKYQRTTEKWWGDVGDILPEDDPAQSWSDRLDTMLRELVAHWNASVRVLECRQCSYTYEPESKCDQLSVADGGCPNECGPLTPGRPSLAITRGDLQRQLDSALDEVNSVHHRNTELADELARIRARAINPKTGISVEPLNGGEWSHDANLDDDEPARVCRNSPDPSSVWVYHDNDRIKCSDGTVVMFSVSDRKWHVVELPKESAYLMLDIERRVSELEQYAKATMRGATDGALESIQRHRPLSRMVAEFHRAAGVPILTTPQVPSDERVRLRGRLIAEEFIEFMASCFEWANTNTVPLADIKSGVERVLSGPVRVDLPEAVDAIIDMNYINAGSLHEFGVKQEPVTAIVHAANMAKFADGVNQRPDGKIIKPEGWTPPDIAGELRKQGLDG